MILLMMKKRNSIDSDGNSRFKKKAKDGRRLINKSQLYLSYNILLLFFVVQFFHDDDEKIIFRRMM